ncbi:MAG TPA: hypothetical protein VIZ43_19270 [Trebonia sp.]
MTTAPEATQQAAVDAALLVLKSMGLSLEDLTAAPSNRPPVPTFAEYVPVVAATVTPGTLRAYRPYWKRTVEQWGGQRLDEPTSSEIKQLVAYVKANAVQRRNSRGGHHAAENLISALRCLYQRAVDDGLIDQKDNPAARSTSPAACRPPAGRWTTPAWRRSTRSPPRRATTRNSTRSSCGCTPRPPADAPGRSRSVPRTWAASSAWSCSGRRARRSAGSRSPRP